MYRILAVLLMVAGCVFADVRVGCAGPAEDARAIYDAVGIKGGFIVDLGCGAGELTAALRTSDNMVVQGLDASPANVEKARAAIQSAGLYGPVSVNQFDGKRLPYVDNLANLIVVEDPGQVPMAEIVRVLAPLGVACVKHDGTWTKTVKPWPADIDQWPQHLYGGDNNAVAHDQVVGPPRHYQWTSTPQWSRALPTTIAQADSGRCPVRTSRRILRTRRSQVYCRPLRCFRDVGHACSMLSFGGSSASPACGPTSQLSRSSTSLAR